MGFFFIFFNNNHDRVGNIKINYEITKPLKMQVHTLERIAFNAPDVIVFFYYLSDDIYKITNCTTYKFAEEFVFIFLNNAPGIILYIIIFFFLQRPRKEVTNNIIFRN